MHDVLFKAVLSSVFQKFQVIHKLLNTLLVQLQNLSNKPRENDVFMNLPTVGGRPICF